MNPTTLVRTLSKGATPIGGCSGIIRAAFLLALSLGTAPAGAQQADNSPAEALDRIGMRLQQHAPNHKVSLSLAQHRHGLQPLRRLQPVAPPQWVTQLHFDQQLLSGGTTTASR
jgi:hypothetical protein